MKNLHNGPPPEGRRRGVQTEESQDLCGAAAADQPMFKSSSQHRAVDLPNKYMTKDFLSGFRHGRDAC